jgi:hypothetical protein
MVHLKGLLLLTTAMLLAVKSPSGGMVDAPDSKSGAERRGSSSLPMGTFL